MTPSLFLGIPSVFSRKFTKTRIWDICRKYGCTTFSLLGGMMMGLYAEPPRPDDADNPVRLVLSAGTPRSIWTEFEKRFGVLIHEWYGSVEGGFAHKLPGVGPVGSFGKPLDGVMEMKIVREDGSDAAPFETGEIICSQVVAGNWKSNTWATRRLPGEKTRGGWLRTGDMGHMDNEGWYFFDYRQGGGLRRHGDFIQSRIRRGGHCPASRCDRCLCVRHTRGRPGRRGKAISWPPWPPVDGRTIEPADIFNICREKLEGNAVPSYLQVVREIPKTISEKNLDRILKQEFSPKGGQRL